MWLPYPAQQTPHRPRSPCCLHCTPAPPADPSPAGPSGVDAWVLVAILCRIPKSAFPPGCCGHLARSQGGAPYVPSRRRPGDRRGGAERLTQALRHTGQPIRLWSPQEETQNLSSGGLVEGVAFSKPSPLVCREPHPALQSTRGGRVDCRKVGASPRCAPAEPTGATVPTRELLL